MPPPRNRVVTSIRPSSRLKTATQVVCVMLTLATFMSVAMMPLHSTLVQYNVYLQTRIDHPTVRGSSVSAPPPAPKEETKEDEKKTATETAAKEDVVESPSSGATAPKEEPKEEASESAAKDESPSSGATAPATCTPEQRETILAQLPSEECITKKGQPWANRCSFSYASQCPDTNPWLGKYFQQESSSPRVAIHVACGKGMNAIDTLRMMSNNPAIDEKAWSDETTKQWGNDNQRRVCDKPQPTLSTHVSTAKVHCIEPEPRTAELLVETVKQLKWQDSLLVTNSAVAKKMECQEEGCKEVPESTLDEYIQTTFDKDSVIDYLRIGQEGFDAQVLEGGKSALSRVGYIDFRYSWKGIWGQYKLSHVVQSLEENNKFACYWAGQNGSLWRMSHGCWMDHYDLRYWANVACVNTGLPQFQTLAARMETLFLETLAAGETIRYTTKEGGDSGVASVQHS